MDAALKSCPTVRHVFVSQRTEKQCMMGEMDVPLEEVRGQTLLGTLLGTLLFAVELLLIVCVSGDVSSVCSVCCRTSG